MIPAISLPYVVLALATAAQNAPAQPDSVTRDSVVVVPDAPTCASCTIATRRLVTLGTAEGPGSISSMIQNLGVDGRGRYWVLVGEHPPLVFDAGGRFVATVGRRGTGPGEVQYPSDFAPLPGDSVLLLDSGRATVFDADLKPVRNITLTAGFFPVHVIEWPIFVVANGMVSTKVANGWPLHSVTFEERVAHVDTSFGPERSTLGAQGVPMLMQRIAPSTGMTFWSADWGRYRLTHWAAPGKKTVTLERRPAWFPLEASRGGMGSPTTPPDPVIAGIHQDSAGLLWVFTKTAAPTWRSAWPKGTAPGSEIDVRRLAPEKMYRTTIEVIDPRTRRIVARRIIPELIVAALPDRRAAAYVVGPDEVPRIAILRVDLVRRTSPLP
jgi:hypothetical protein